MSERFLNNQHSQGQLEQEVLDQRREGSVALPERLPDISTQWLELFATRPSLGIDIETDQGTERWVFAAQLENFLKKFPENKKNAPQYYLDKVIVKRVAFAQLAPAEVVRFYPADWARKALLPFSELITLIESIGVMKKGEPMLSAQISSVELPRFSFFTNQNITSYEEAFAYLEETDQRWRDLCRHPKNEVLVEPKVKKKRTRKEMAEIQPEAAPPEPTFEERLTQVFPGITRYEIGLIRNLLNLDAAALEKPVQRVVIHKELLSNVIERFPKDGSDDLADIDSLDFRALYSRQTRRVKRLSEVEELELAKLSKRGNQAALVLLADVAQQHLPSVQDDKTKKILQTLVDRCFGYQNPSQDNLALTSVWQHLEASLPEDTVLTKELVHELTNEGAEARKWLAVANVGLVVEAAEEVYYERGNTLPFLELIQIGNVGLMSATIYFDYSMGNQFSTFAYRVILRRLRKVIQRDSRLIKVSNDAGGAIRKMIAISLKHEAENGKAISIQNLAEAMNVSEDKIRFYQQVAERDVSSFSTPLKNTDGLDLGSTIADTTTPLTEEIIAEQQRKERLEEALNRLAPRTAEVLRLRYGLVDDRFWTLREIAQKFGVQRQMIGIIEKRGLKQLRENALNKNLADFL